MQSSEPFSDDQNKHPIEIHPELKISSDVGGVQEEGRAVREGVAPQCVAIENNAMGQDTGKLV
jgi:hypothetical protein